MTSPAGSSSTPRADGGLIVTLDGPAGTGKSTVGRRLAERLGLEFLDTGAMYRAATALVIDQGIDSNDEEAVARAAADAELHFDWSTAPPTLVAHGRPIMGRLRDADVASLISTLAAQARLRNVMVALQRRIGAAHNRLLSEGRDQGSVVFVDATVKIYLHASAIVRAQRRAKQLRQAGRSVDVKTIEAELIERDRKDAARTVGPLVKSIDAIDVDTSDMTFDESLDTLERLVREHAPAASFGSAPEVKRDHG